MLELVNCLSLEVGNGVMLELVNSWSFYVGNKVGMISLIL